MKNVFLLFVNSKKFPYVVAFFLLLPSLLWIFLDNNIWPWDQAWYGEVSVDLYYKLTHSFDLWPRAMVTAFGQKAPGIAWFGQFFVPLEKVVGSVDNALMMSIFLVQFITLILTHHIIMAVTKSRKGLSYLGMLIMAGAPLFVGMGHHYLVESHQLLAVVFFIFILTQIEKWNWNKVISLVIMALAYAMVIKITSPLYLFFPAIWGFLLLYKKLKENHAKQDSGGKKHIWGYVFGIAFSYCVVAWYVVNWDVIYNFMKLASSGSAAELYGTKGDFLNKFSLWASFFQKSFFIPWVAVATSFLLGVSLVFYLLKLKKIGFGKLFSFEGFSWATILSVLGFFSFQINEENRYLLPLLVYVVLIICLLLEKINNKWPVYFFAFLFLGQYVFVGGVALGLIDDREKRISTWVTESLSSQEKMEKINFIVEQTCNQESQYKINMVGVELPELNANSVEYYAMQNRLKTDILCYYTSLGYAENDPETAWKRLETLNPPYFITSEETISQNLAAFNGTSLRILERIKNDSSFMQQPVLNSENILIFRNNLPVK